MLYSRFCDGLMGVGEWKKTLCHIQKAEPDLEKSCNRAAVSHNVPAFPYDPSFELSCTKNAFT